MSLARLRELCINLITCKSSLRSMFMQPIATTMDSCLLIFSAEVSAEVYKVHGPQSIIYFESWLGLDLLSSTLFVPLAYFQGLYQLKVPLSPQSDETQHAAIDACFERHSRSLTFGNIHCASPIQQWTTQSVLSKCFTPLKQDQKGFRPQQAELWRNENFPSIDSAAAGSENGWQTSAPTRFYGGEHLLGEAPEARGKLC